MANAKKKWVKLLTFVTIPADMLADKKEKRFDIGTKLQLPAAYADHLVHDRFAAFCDAPKKQTASTGGADAKKLADAEAALAAAKEAFEKAQGTLDEAGAKEALDAAQAAVDALKPAE